MRRHDAAYFENCRQAAVMSLEQFYCPPQAPGAILGGAISAVLRGSEERIV